MGRGKGGKAGMGGRGEGKEWEESVGDLPCVSLIVCLKDS